MGLRPAVGAAVLAMVAALFAVPQNARAGSGDPERSGSVDFSGTGSLVTQVRTHALRSAVPPAPRAPRIAILGTGIERALFPEPLRAQVAAAGLDATDTHGYGTIAASTILQLLPRATLVSRRVRALDASWTMLDLSDLARALRAVRDDPPDLVLLAFPPQAALDPVSELLGHARYTEGIHGMDALVDAMLHGGATLRERDALERFRTHARAWRRVLRAVRALDRDGIPVVAPAGDFTRRGDDGIVPLYGQTVFGLSALPQVITVGASYLAPGDERLSPTSGRGPTLALRPKPDLVAPSDVVTMLPEVAFLRWPDDSARVAFRPIDWADAAAQPASCPSVSEVYRCVLQGSSMVSAAVVAANLGALAAAGTAPGGRRDEVFRGLAHAAASRTVALASEGARAAYAWEAGSGMLDGLAGVDPARTPVPMGWADLGEVAGRDRRVVRLWRGGARAASAEGAVDSFLGPDAGGAATAAAWADDGRVDARVRGRRVTLVAPARDAAPGIYAGRLRIAPRDGEAVAVPLWLTQTMPVPFHADYAYNEQMTGGREGERVERATAVLFAGLPRGVGLVGDAFKSFSTRAWRSLGGDPTASVVLRYATTRDAVGGGARPRAHGSGVLRAVPPGFYKLHLLTDHAIDAEQARGRRESLGIKIGSSGPDLGGDLLVAGTRACRDGGDAPLGCVEAMPDPATGLCAGDGFAIACGEVAFAVPAALVSRAVHLVEHGEVESEWQACGVDLPADGDGADLATLVAQAERCPGTTSPTAWRVDPGAPACLGPRELAGHPGGHPADVRATLEAPPAVLPGQNLPIAVLTYRFRLPDPNTYTIATLSAQYAVRDAIVAARFSTSSSSLDASHGLLVVDDPDLDVQPALTPAPARGSLLEEWSVMSANAAWGVLSLILVPTVWTAEPGGSAAEVALCDVALRVSTYAKSSWGVATAGGVHRIPMLDRGLGAQIRPRTTRVRALWNGRRFVDAGTEHEALGFALQIPKDTTEAHGSPHRVRSPRGGPAYLAAARRLATDGTVREDVLARRFEAHDPGLGVTRLACARGDVRRHPARAAEFAACDAWERVLGTSRAASRLFDDISVNGRFAGTLALDRGAIERAGGAVVFEIASRDDGGAFEDRWARAGTGYDPFFGVSDFYDDERRPFSLTLLGGVIRLARDADGGAVLVVRAAGIAGETHTVSAPLH